jgi:hypothetical protein
MKQQNPIAALKATPMTAPTEATAYIAVLWSEKQASSTPKPTFQTLFVDVTHSDRPPSSLLFGAAEVLEVDTALVLITVDVLVCETPGVIVWFPPPSRQLVSPTAVELTWYRSPVPPVPYPRASLNMMVNSDPAFRLTCQFTDELLPKSTSKGSKDWSSEMTVMLKGACPLSTVWLQSIGKEALHWTMFLWKVSTLQVIWVWFRSAVLRQADSPYPWTVII